MEFWILVWISSGSIFVSDYCQEMYDFCNNRQQFAVSVSSKEVWGQYNNLNNREKESARIFKGKEYEFLPYIELKHKKK